MKRNLVVRALANTRHPVTRSTLRPGAYADSLVLMQLQRALAALPGVLDAGAVMATAANRELLAVADLLPEEAAGARADDLLIVVKATTETAAEEALGRVDELLQARRPSEAQGYRPRSLATALKELPQARWVLVSVPGRYAAGVAREALESGRNVFLYSDNVSLADEAALKHTAQARGLMVMGPDCGTAIVGGVGLGFANRVRRGRVGLVGASGTGLQAITCRLDALGVGVSQAVGTGGRDLAADVGGITALQGLELLAHDPETRVIVVVSKPPAATVAGRVLRAAQRGGRPVVAYFLGSASPAHRVGHVRFARSMSEAAEMAAELAVAETGDEHPSVAAVDPGPRYLRGLFSGGTLAYEMLLGVQTLLTPIYSNAPISEDERLADPLRSRGHTLLDLGADEFTAGRLHPMIDQELRLRRLRQEAADPEVALILLDVVLGEGAHADPASELAPAIAEVREKARTAGRELEILTLVVGTDEDPQDPPSQVEVLTRAGARVVRGVGEAIEYVSLRLAGNADPDAGPPVALADFRSPLAAVNVGLEAFFHSLLTQGAAAVSVDWRPPAGGNEKLAGILAKMRKKGK